MDQASKERLLSAVTGSSGKKGDLWQCRASGSVLVRLRDNDGTEDAHGYLIRPASNAGRFNVGDNLYTDRGNVLPFSVDDLTPDERTLLMTWRLEGKV